MITQRRQTMRVMWISISLQPKLKGTSVWPFNAHSKVATG